MCIRDRYEAASQAEVIKIINEKDIHLFFIDIQLKDSSGLELAKKIRQYKQHALTEMCIRDRLKVLD